MLNEIYKLEERIAELEDSKDEKTDLVVILNNRKDKRLNKLKRNNSLDVTYFPTGQSFDASVLKNNFDVILLWSNYEWGMPKELENITKLDIPVIARAADPGNAKKTIKNHKEWKIDYYFHFLNESFFYDLYPSHFKYKTIVYGIEPSLFENVMPFEKRIKRQILNSGAIGNTKFISKMINNIRNPKFPKESTGWTADAPGGGCRTVVNGEDRGGVRSGDSQVDGDVNIVVCPRSPYCGNEDSGKFKIMWWWDNNTEQDSAIISVN